MEEKSEAQKASEMSSDEFLKDRLISVDGSDEDMMPIFDIPAYKHKVLKEYVQDLKVRLKGMIKVNADEIKEATKLQDQSSAIALGQYGVGLSSALIALEK